MDPNNMSKPPYGCLCPEHALPALENNLLIRVIHGETENIERLPIWIMRQAGRYMQKFREIRTKHSFFEICRTPSLACEVTMLPIDRFNLDAAIIFSDILVVPQALGVNVEMKEGVGPVIPNPVTVATIKDLQIEGAVDRLKYVGEAITLTRKKLMGRVPLIGFAGAPWTLMAYMVEGGGSKTYSKAKRWLYCNEKETHALLTILTDVIIDYLVMQVTSGAQILQVFESCAEHLNDDLFEKFCIPYLKRIPCEVNEKLRLLRERPIPMILFAKGGNYSLAKQRSLGYQAISVDWTVSPKIARETLGPKMIIQGNLDPCILYGTEEVIREQVKKMVQEFGANRYIVNLGHGMYPDIPEEGVENFVKAVRNLRLSNYK